MVANDRSRPGLLESVRVAARGDWAPSGSVIFVNENENENREIQENNEFVNEN